MFYFQFCRYCIKNNSSPHISHIFSIFTHQQLHNHIVNRTQSVTRVTRVITHVFDAHQRSTLSFVATYLTLYKFRGPLPKPLRTARQWTDLQPIHFGNQNRNNTKKRSPKTNNEHVWKKTWLTRFGFLQTSFKTTLIDEHITCYNLITSIHSGIDHLDQITLITSHSNKHDNTHHVTHYHQHSFGQLITLFTSHSNKHDNTHVAHWSTTELTRSIVHLVHIPFKQTWITHISHIDHHHSPQIMITLSHILQRIHTQSHLKHHLSQQSLDHLYTSSYNKKQCLQHTLHNETMCMNFLAGN